MNKQDWIRILNAHESIIDLFTWTQVQNKLQSRLRSSSITLETSVLSGKVKCAICGKPMKRNVYYNKSRTIQYYGLTCASYKIGAMNCTNVHMITGLSLEKFLVDEINKLIEHYLQEDNVIINNRQDKILQEQEKVLADLNLKITTEENKLTNLYEDKLEGVITKDQYIIYSKKFENSINQLKSKVSSIISNIESLRLKKAELIDKSEIIKKYSHIEKLTRPIVDEFIDSVLIGEKIEGQSREITINWNF